MAGRVWQVEMVVERGGRASWAPCTATLYRTRPRLQLETDPFSRDNFKTLLHVNRHLVVRYKQPIARDFTLHLESGRQVW